MNQLHPRSSSEHYFFKSDAISTKAGHAEVREGGNDHQRIYTDDGIAGELLRRSKQERVVAAGMSPAIPAVAAVADCGL